MTLNEAISIWTAVMLTAIVVFQVLTEVKRRRAAKQDEDVARELAKRAVAKFIADRKERA